MRVKQRYFQLLFTVPFLLLGSGCKRGADRPIAPSSSVPLAKAGTQAKTEIQSNEGVVKLESGMMANIKIEELNEKVLPLTFNATGKVNFNEDQMARILAPVAG